MTKKLKKYLLSFAGISLTTALTVAASCGSNSGSEKPVDNRELVLDLKDQVDWKLSRLTSETNYEELKTRFASINTNVQEATDDEVLKSREALEELNSQVEEKLIALKGENYIKRVQNSDQTGGFSQVQKDSIKLGVSWSNSNAQHQAIKSIVYEYNQLIDSISKMTNEEEKQAAYKKHKISPSSKPVEVIQFGNSYGDAANRVQKSLSSKDQSGFVNLIINYPPVAAMLAQSEMLLSFNSKNKNIETDINELFDKNFTGVNSQIEGVKKPSTFTLPLFKSTNVLGINGAVLGYFLETLKDLQVQFDPADSAYFEQFINASKSDREEVKKIWGEKVAQAEDVIAEYKKAPLTKSIFETYTEIIKFANTMQKLFAKSAVDNPDIHVFGIDDIAGVYEQALYAAIGADAGKMIQSVSTNNGKISVDFTTLGNQNAEARTKTQEMFNALSQAFQVGSVYAFPSGQYSSSEQTKHRMAFSIGSTAGYAHNFKKSPDVLVRSTINSLDTVLNQDGVLFFRDKLAAKGNKPGDSEAVLARIGGRNNKLYKSGTPTDPALPNAIKDTYYYMSKDAATDEKIQNLKTDKKSIIVNFVLTDQPRTKALKVELDKITDGSVENFVVANQKGDDILFIVIKNASETDITKFDDIDNLRKTNETKFKELLAKAKLSVFQETDHTIVNENELFAQITPSKWTKSDPKKVLFLQGPSLIGVRSNNEDELATKAFVYWLLNYKEELTYKQFDRQGNIEEGKSLGKGDPISFIQQKMSYVSGTKTLTSLPDNTFGNNKYLSVVLQELKALVADNDYVAFEEPGGVGSDAFRNQIKTAWNQKQKQYTEKANEVSFDSFIALTQLGQNK
ncbi:P80 family lipoprotein [Mycoplasmopsis felis]|uniref:P68 family surface lipoprotein n=1 Tax=Mycoplasmopsis felis TaxID=33923 RepID=UPI002AF6C1B2|nr:P80 family lipoprotein [Mycoplasmopsis felis]WQQ02091.1 P80 family lipoprotein [Mycoplasmopsis felis]